MIYTYKEYEKLINLSLSDKISWSTQLISYAIKNSKTGFSISMSWGKDSVVMTHLINNICKKGKVIFANTYCEYPETYKYRDMMLKDSFFKDLEYYETKPIKHFWVCVKEYGYPHNRQSAEQDKPGQKSKRSPKCCLYLKEKPLKNKQKELGTDSVFIGIQATESMNRRLTFMRLGGYYYNTTRKENVCMPLAIWTDKDVKRYAKDNNIPLNPLYSQMKRTGCMYCTGFKNWKEVMAKYNPRIYSKILKEKEGQRTIDNWECDII